MIVSIYGGLSLLGLWFLLHTGFGMKKVLSVPVFDNFLSTEVFTIFLFPDMTVFR